MTARDILKRKGTGAVTIAAGELVATAVNVLAQKNIGALIVRQGEAVVGVIDERDVVRALSRHGSETLGLNVRDVMKEQVLTCAPGDAAKDLMETITRQRVRHLPVLDGHDLVGVVSIGDLLKSRLEEMETEQHVLRDRLLGR